MKGVVCCIGSNFAEKLQLALNEEFVAFEFISYPSQSKPSKHKIIINTSNTKIHRECLMQIKAFCDGFIAAVEMDEEI